MHGEVHHFGVIGLINGLAVLGDIETNSHWDHITGDAFEGPLAGEKLDVWPIRMTTVKASLIETPEIEIYFSAYFSVWWWINQRWYPRFISAERLLIPPPFYLSMGKPIDPRLPRQTQGLGVIMGKHAKYYPVKSIPKEGIKDNWHGRNLHVKLNGHDGVPYAKWQDTGESPMQLLTRWYGFSYTYPGCEIWERATKNQTGF